MNYQKLVSDVYYNGISYYNKRTKHEVIEKFFGYIKVDISEGIPLPGLRKVYPHIAMTELLWTLSGHQSLMIMHDNNVNIWNEFIEPDTNIIKNAYGHRLRVKFGRDQIQLALKELKYDISSRQVVCCLWDPSSDGMSIGNYEKNIPCPYAFQLVRAEHKLNLILNIRSSDIILGLPYDYMMYAMLLNAFSNSLNIKPGHIVITLGNAHIYYKYMNEVHSMIEADQAAGTLPLHSFTIEQLSNYKKEYVDHIKRQHIDQPELKYKFEVIQ